MNIIDVSIDSIVIIFSHIDGNALLLAMKTCKFFKYVVDKIIEEADHHDIYLHLFRISALPNTTLKKYLLKIPTIDDTKLANLMLAAFTTDNDEFVSVIITFIIDRSPGYCIGGILFEANQWFLKDEFFRDNAFFNSIPYPIKEKSWSCIFYQNYFDTWIFMIMIAGRIDVFDQMFPRNKLVKYRIFDYAIKSNYPTTTIIKIDNHIKQMLYHGDTNIFNYYHKHIESPSYCFRKINDYAIYILYGGHLDLFLQCLKNQNARHYHKLIISCLLRFNHIDQYRKYDTLMRLDSFYRIIKRHIVLADVLTNWPTINNIVLPPIASETIEFCMQEFDISIKFSPSNFVVNPLAQDNIMNNWSEQLNVNCLIKMIYFNEPDVLEYCAISSFNFVRLNKKYGEMNRYAYVALCGGHLTLFRTIFYNCHGLISMGDFDVIICIGLLRYNHVDQYRDYIRTISLINRSNIIFEDIFSIELSIDIDLPKLSVSTFEFLIKEFDLRVEKTNIGPYEKYLTDELKALLQW